MASDTVDTNSTVHFVSQTVNFECYEGTINVYDPDAVVVRPDATVSANKGRFLGVVTVDLPEVAARTQELTGASISGVMKMPALGTTESMTLTLHWRSMTAWTARLAEQRAHDLALYGAVNRYNAVDGTMGVLPVKIEFRGIPTRTSIGKFAPNEFMDSASEFEVITLQVTIDGEVETRISPLDTIYKIHGTDYAYAVRAAMGN